MVVVQNAWVFNGTPQQKMNDLGISPWKPIIAI